MNSWVWIVSVECPGNESVMRWLVIHPLCSNRQPLGASSRSWVPYTLWLTGYRIERVKPINSETVSRRLKLRVAAKLMMFLAMGSIVYVFIAGIRQGDGGVPSVPSLRVIVGDMEVGDARILNWEGRPVLVYRRRAVDMGNLRNTDERLVDPHSQKPDQPEWAINDFRSVSPEWFVAIGLGTDLGCTVKFLPAADESFRQRTWSGGFVDTCRKARYDLAGRVYRSQYATRNLVVPSYTLSEDTLILGR